MGYTVCAAATPRRIGARCPRGQSACRSCVPSVVIVRLSSLDRPFRYESLLARKALAEGHRRLGEPFGAGAFAVARVEVVHSGVFGEVHDCPFVVYATITRKTHGVITLRPLPVATSSLLCRAERCPCPPAVQ